MRQATSLQWAWKRNMQYLKSGNVSGERGLLLAVIALAVRDARGGHAGHRRSALSYFESELYRQDLEHLGLSADSMPLALSAN